MIRIEVSYKSALPDPIGNRLKTEIETLGIQTVNDVRVVDVYILSGRLSEDDIRGICEQLLVDNITQCYEVCPRHSTPYAMQASIPGSAGTYSCHNHKTQCNVIEIRRKPGVIDPVEESVLKGIRDMGLMADAVKTAKRYLISGRLSDEQLRNIADKILANPIIEDVFFNTWIGTSENGGLAILKRASSSFKESIINLMDKCDDDLIKISAVRRLSLSLSEMKAIQSYFSGLGRNPTEIELETIAQTWSEHCVHKTLKGEIEYNGRLIRNLLASTIMRATKELNKPWCVSVFEDNAGIIRFDDKYNLCFKVETHNHPSAIEPYGGASTGIGGVIRDILGTGLAGRPIMNTDVFCFGPPDLAQDSVPKGVLHPKRIFKGVIAGVRDYGNRMGIPTANGAIFFDNRYIGNPLVYCGTVGLIPNNRCKKGTQKGDLIILIGGRTGRDGIHGVTFASSGLDKDSETHSISAVQIGSPITEKRFSDLLIEARDKGLYNCITDCGGGGLSSAIGEMAKELGAKVYLDKVPLKYKGLLPAEIWISESQERMIIAVPSENEKEIIRIFEKEDVEATTIGYFTGDKKLHLLYNNKLIGCLDMDFLHNGLPTVKRKAEWKPPQYEEPDLQLLEQAACQSADNRPDLRHSTPNPPATPDYGIDLKKIISSWNVCSKERVIREYDHEVQGTSVLKPLQGIANDGPGDACIIEPVLGSRRGIIVSNGMNPKYGDIDPYHMAASAIDEALRQIVAVGGSIEQVSLLDNFCWGNTERPECLGALVRAAQACYDYSLLYETPFISGKDSLFNEFDNGKECISIPHSLLISAISVMPDVTKAVSMDVKGSGNLIYIVGLTRPELGGSHYYFIHGYIGNIVPKVDARLGRRIMASLSKAIALGLVRACHDCSEGGLAVAAAEMSFAGGLGMTLSLANMPLHGQIETDGVILFSESNSRFIVEIRPQDQKRFEGILADLPYGQLGKVTDDDQFIIKNKDGSTIISEDIFTLKRCWQEPLERLV